MNRLIQIIIPPLCLSGPLVTAEESAVRSSAPVLAEEIVFFHPLRPPIIEVYAWDEKEHWKLCRVYFDSDGDWALDTTLHFLNEPKSLSETDKGAQEKFDKQLHVVRKDNVLFVPFDDPTNRIRVYTQAALYRALEADKKFRLGLSGYLRVLQAPLPAASKNFELRESAGYQGLLERLKKVKLSKPPTIPENQ